MPIAEFQLTTLYFTKPHTLYFSEDRNLLQEQIGKKKGKEKEDETDILCKFASQ